MAAITGHEVPGGASISVRPSAQVRSRTARISGGDMASPTRSRPWTKATPFMAPASRTPSSRPVSVMAPSGHTAMHPPQLWQSSGKVSTVSPRTAMARNRHISAHFLHWVHFSRSISGTGVVTVLVSWMDGRRNRWALGSSTSQSSNWTGPDTDTARLVATVVFPVPPLPLAILMIIGSNLPE